MQCSAHGQQKNNRPSFQEQDAEGSQLPASMRKGQGSSMNMVYSQTPMRNCFPHAVMLERRMVRGRDV